MKKFLSYILIFFSLFSVSLPALASSTTSGYAWSENTGYIDFSGVSVTNADLSGWAYSPNIGWISFNCLNTSGCGTVNYKVSNSNGQLSGYAWSENTGYIDFSQVQISPSTGIFSGYAYSSNIGWVSLNCSNTSSCDVNDYKVTTSWKIIHNSAGAIVAQNNTNTTSPDEETNKIQDSNKNESSCFIDFKRVLKLQKPKMFGDDIKSLQVCLNIKKYLSPDLIVDGIYGPKTTKWVTLFQKENALVADGVWGIITNNKHND